MNKWIKLRVIKSVRAQRDKLTYDFYEKTHKVNKYL